VGEVGISMEEFLTEVTKRVTEAANFAEIDDLLLRPADVSDYKNLAKAAQEAEAAEESLSSTAAKYWMSLVTPFLKEKDKYEEDLEEYESALCDWNN
jgi:hypothetical protein